MAATIEIKMFSPTNVRNKATSQRQTAKTNKEGVLVVESEDQYGELDSVLDVMMAWNTLASIWMKIHPEWPVALIGVRVCYAMKLFNHCEGKAREVMVDFSNRLLASNASRAANRRGPMPYDRAWNLAGNVAISHGFGREPTT